MKITYIHQHFKLPTEGGGSRPYEFAKRMVADGHEVTMICGGETQLETDFEGILIKRLAVPYRNEMSTKERMFAFVSFMCKSSIYAAKTSSDVIFASSTPLTVAIPGILGKFVQRVPLVFEVRDLWPSVPIELGYLKNPLAITFARLLEKITYRVSKTVVALSPGMQDGVLRVVRDKEVVVIPNACDFSLFDNSVDECIAFRKMQHWQAGETVVVYAGGFGPTYDLEWVIRLAAAVKDHPIRFILLGEGRDSEKLKTLAEELGLKSDDLLLGMRPKSEVAKFIQSADIVISSLSQEPCLEVNSLNKVFDGLAAGKPIVVNHGGWLKEAIELGGAGWKLERDINQAANQMIEIASDPEAIKLASIRSLELGKASFDRDELYSKLIDTLRRAVENKGNHQQIPSSTT